MLVNQRRFICIGLFLCGLLCSIARADTYKLNDGSTVSGDIVSVDENGMRLRLADGNYSDPVSWSKFSQDDLKKIAKADPKKGPLIAPFIEVTEEQRIQRTEVPNPVQPARLKRPAPQSLFGAMLSSTVGLFVIVILYGAGIYAAYEVAIYRRRAPALVCGLAAVPAIGFLSPVIFLWMPAQKRSAEEEETYQAEHTPPPEAPSFIVPGSLATPETAPENPGGLHIAHTAPGAAGANLPQTQTFQRGAFMFNRRFFETKFSGFFGVIRRDAEKDMIIVIKSARGEFQAERITRITANDLHAQVRKGQATEEVLIPFTEIQEVRLKHKDSPN